MITLVGLPGSGKTHIGTLLGARLGVPFTDIDKEIIAMCGISIPEIFTTKGEPAFRNLESQCLEKALKNPGKKVVATGGGTVLAPRNRALLKTTTCVFLDRPVAAICADVDTCGRPLLAKGPQEVQSLNLERRAFYLECAHIVIPGDITLEQAVNKIISLLP